MLFELQQLRALGSLFHAHLPLLKNLSLSAPPLTKLHAVSLRPWEPSSELQPPPGLPSAPFALG